VQLAQYLGYHWTVEESSRRVKESKGATVFVVICFDLKKIHASAIIIF